MIKWLHSRKTNSHLYQFFFFFFFSLSHSSHFQPQLPLAIFLPRASPSCCPHIPSFSHFTPHFLCSPLGRAGVGELSGGHFLSRHPHGYVNTWEHTVCCMCLCRCVYICVCLSPYPGGGCKAEMLTLSSARKGGGRWRFGALAKTGVSKPAGEHMKGRLCRHAASERQQGCDEVRPVA